MVIIFANIKNTPDMIRDCCEKYQKVIFKLPSIRMVTPKRKVSVLATV